MRDALHEAALMWLRSGKRDDGARRTAARARRSKPRVASTEKLIVVRTRSQLMKALDLSPADGRKIGRRVALNDKIIETAKRKSLSPAQVATRAGISRARAKAILGRGDAESDATMLRAVLKAIGGPSPRV